MKTKTNKGGNMKVAYLFLIVLLSQSALADDLITVKVESMANTSGNGSIEACGTAVHKDGKRPLLVTLKHDKSYYTTLTAANDQWCILFKRWTFSGKVDVNATTMDSTEQSENMAFSLIQ